MRAFVAASLILALTATTARAQAPATAPAPLPPLRAKLTDEAIRQAVQQTLAEDKKGQQLAREGAYGGEKVENFSRQFSESKIPDCLHADALKFQPTFFGGLLAIPFWVAAAVRGKCR
ncbi:hypothetical protein NX773_03720 [Massilia solisilvae]|uniref:DUF3613 domain-containing protein n=1 Tax=Massilia solisilvae TaxID=1811225 RepID=A0ABT2BGV0_9BURK|nr:hypothetical protein [Massilia solisilvae]MCS0607275.1 hypothetical protein [Massilia solisilvae]